MTKFLYNRMIYLFYHSNTSFISIRTDFFLACFSTLINLSVVASPFQQGEIRISIQQKNVLLSKVFNEIESKTNYSILIRNNDVNVNEVVSIEAKNKTVGEILELLFKGKDIKYEIQNKRISVYKPARKKTSGSIRGNVKDSNGEPLPGVNIVVHGTKIGVITDIDGNYFLSNVPEGTHVIDASFIGYEKKSVTVKGLKNGEQRQLDFTMSYGVKLNEVVVTALGIKREEKALGYSISKLDNDDFTQTVSANWLGGLSGKVAGLNFDQSSAAPGASIRVTLRGEGSLSHDRNTALFVIDGVPVSSDMSASNDGGGYSNTDAPIDYGNSASDFNPDDIESISVLKGPAATAMYGSRAANGAVVITTKSGRITKGLGVTFSSSAVFEQASFWPDFQHEYGSGDYRRQTVGSTEVKPAEFSFWTVGDTPRNYSRYSFGPRYDGSLKYLYASRNWETDEYTKLPFVEQDWYKGFFETGMTFRNSVTIDGNNGKGGSVRLSITDQRNSWIVPNTGFDSQNINLSVSQKLNRFLKLSGKVTYYRKNSDNLPMSGYSTASPLYTLIWSPTSVSVNDYYNEYKSGRINKVYEEGLKTNLLINATADNPYLQVYEQLNTLARDRVYGNVSLDISLIKNKLNLALRSGMDMSNDFRTQRKPFYSNGYMSGMYKEQTVYNLEMNNDFLLSYKDRFGDFDINASLGGNSMYSNYRNVIITASRLLEPGIYMLRNSDGNLLVNPTRRRKGINSFYGFANIGWRNMLYLELTGRNDWSSTLAPGNNSYFYPSVNVSVLLDEVFNLHQRASWIDMLKIRGSWANVGNDTDPYELEQVYNNSDFVGSYLLSNKVQNYNLKPENVESWEFGLEARMFKNRLGLDFTFYNTNTTDQIINVPADYATGASSRIINAGKVNNKGIEISANIKPVRTRDWKWNMTLNWSKNWNKLVELAPGVNLWQLNTKNTIGQRVFIYAYPGKELGRIYGTGYERAPEGAFYRDENGNKVDCSGQVVVDAATGNPVLGTELRDLGSIYPDWKAGMTQTLSYKNFTLYMSFSAQMGGHAYSVTNFGLSYMGKLKNSLEGRYDGLIHPGVNRAADGTYTKNEKITTDIVDYYNLVKWNRNNVEENTFSTSFLKMKECRLDYKFTPKMCSALRLQGLSLGVFATNLFCITQWPQYDPEVASFSGSSLYRGVETGGYPMTRSYGVNLKLAF